MEPVFSLAAVLSIIFNIFVGIAVPIILVVLIRKKFKMRIGVLFIGACAYIASHLFLQGIIDSCVYLIKPLADFFVEQSLARAIVFSVLHGLAELGGYYLIIHLFMKDFKRKENALMFGVGIRIIDSVIAYGFASGISMLMLAINVNSQGFENYLASFGTENIEENRQVLTSMVEMPVKEILGNGFLGLFLMMMTIGVAVLVFQAAKRKDKMYLLPTAGAILVLNNLVMELYSAEILKGLEVCVLLLGVIAVLSCLLAARIYKSDTDDERGRADIIVGQGSTATSAGNRRENKEISIQERLAHVSSVNSKKTQDKEN